MSMLPIKIDVPNNTTLYALKYGLTIIGTFWVCSFAFSNYFGFPMLYGFGAILVCALLIYFMVRFDRSRKRSIEITETYIHDVKRGVVTQIDWSEMHQLYFKVTLVKYRGAVTVTKLFQSQIVAKGRNITVEYQFEDFHQQIAELSHAHVFPLIKQKLEERDTVSFGKVELSRDYLSVKKKKYRTDLIREAKVKDGKLVLKIDGKPLAVKVDIADVANTKSLLAILSKEWVISV